MRTVVLLHIGRAGQYRVGGLVEGLDVVLALKLYHALGHNVLKRSQGAAPTAVHTAMCTGARSYGSLTVSRRLDVYRDGPCLAKLDIVMPARYKPPERLYSAMTLTCFMMNSTMPGGTTQQRLLLNSTS